MSGGPSASIIVPTRERPHYLDVTLASIVPQAARAGAEVLVVADRRDRATATVAEGRGATLISLEPGRGANAARNVGATRARSDVIVLVDDDIEAPPEWLEMLLSGIRSAPGYEVFGGPIRARLEGGGPRACGQERPPITTLDLGLEDRDAELVWSANMAIRRSALERVGGFDEDIHGRGEEEIWQRRYTGAGGRIRYLARAGVEHRRTAPDATLAALVRSAYGHGRGARRNDVRKRTAPPMRRELRILAGCAWHTLRRRCAIGIVMGAHSAGRIREALAERHT